MNRLLDLIDKLIGIPDEDLSSFERQQARILVVFNLAGMIWAPIYAIIHYFVNEEYILGHLCVFFGSLGFVNFVVLRLTKSYRITANLFLVNYLLSVTVFSTLMGGIHAPIIAWTCGIPMVAVILLGSKAGFIWTLIIATETFLFYILYLNGLRKPILDFHTNFPLMLSVSMIGIQFFSFCVCFWYQIIQKNVNQQLKEEQEFLKDQINNQEIERQMIAYDIHDDVVQLMTGALMHLEAGMAHNRDKQALETSADLIQKSLESARRLMNGLRPLELDDLGVVAAISSMVEDVSDIKINYHHDVQSTRLQPLLELALFRICQESLTNIKKHSDATEVTIELIQNEEWISLTIKDNGSGFNPEELKRDSSGLRGMRQRARHFGGSFKVKTSDCTEIIARIPIDTTV